MGYFRGQKIYYDPFWEEREDMPEVMQFYNLGHEDGYSEGASYAESLEKLEEENKALKALIAANYRTMKEEILKDLNAKGIQQEE